MKKPKVLVLRTAGTNCDKETAYAFSYVGAYVELVHINELLSKKKKISRYHIMAIPGGFTYGDDLGAGKILANELRFKLKKELDKFLKNGKLIIGICNGFQILVKSGLLPGYRRFEQEASLILNDSTKFEDRWTYLKRSRFGIAKDKCVWTQNLPEIVYFPVAHAEGKFAVEQDSVLDRLKSNGQIVFQYCNKNGNFGDYPVNPNGSIENIAGICDDSGRVLGLMPHPERHMFFHHHPHWTRLKTRNDGDGMLIFRSGVEYARKNVR